jgi:hypothetical protein
VALKRMGRCLRPAMTLRGVERPLMPSFAINTLPGVNTQDALSSSKSSRVETVALPAVTLAR